MRRIFAVLVICAFAAATSGCAVNFYKRRPEDKAKIQKLTDETKALSQKADALEEAKRLLEERLAKEIGDKTVLLNLASRGLVITMTNDVLFDSGKAKIKAKSREVLDKIASVIKERVPDRNIGVEGHTDNVPIKYSGWKSNWELSTARATSVLHYLVDNCGLEGQKLSAIGYGEYKPIASNDTAEGRALNRRVEIIILPSEIARKSYEEAQQRASEEAKVEEEKRMAESEMK